MAVDGDFANFRAVYDDLTQEVMRSHVQFLADHLANWFRTLDTTSNVAPLIEELQSGLDFHEWSKKQEASARSGGTLTWPGGPEKQLGMKLLLFRSAAEAGKGDLIASFGYMYIPSSDTNISNAAHRFIEQVFGPMARELRRYLEQKASAVPAADRVVSLDHNSKGYSETIEAADELEKVIREANDFPDQEEKEQRIAEVSAVRRLLQAVRVRVEPIIALLKPLADQAKTKLRDNLVGIAISKFLALLGALIQYIWSVL
jgi:hypothetical protein